MLNRITENILKDPENPKYTKLKTTTDTMNRHIMSKRGTVEFLQKVCFFPAVFRRLTNALWTKMGFREKVSSGVTSLMIYCEFLFDLFLMQTENLDRLLVFQTARMKDLRTGAKCLEEVMQNQVQAIEDAESAKRQEIANQKVAKARVRPVIRSQTPRRKESSLCASRH